MEFVCAVSWIISSQKKFLKEKICQVKNDLMENSGFKTGLAQIWHFLDLKCKNSNFQNGKFDIWKYRKKIPRPQKKTILPTTLQIILIIIIFHHLEIGYDSKGFLINSSAHIFCWINPIFIKKVQIVLLPSCNPNRNVWFFCLWICNHQQSDDF